MAGKKRTGVAGRVPRLRFPQFRDAGEWEEKRLGEVAEVIAGQSPAGSNYNDTGEGTPFYQGKADFGEKYIQEPNKWTTQITKLADKGDILMSVRAPVGALNISNAQICIGRGLASIKAKQANLFLYYFLSLIQNTIVGSGGSVFDSITRAQIEELKIPIPSLPEQTKIADCLSSLDELIAAYSQKVAALKAHKKGLMQQLFPAQGETTPRLRFPQFRKAGEWERDKLANLISRLTPPKKIPSTLYQSEGKFPIIDQSQDYISGRTNDRSALVSNNLPLIIFGDHTSILKIVREPFAQGSDGIKILKTKNLVETDYLYQYLQFNSVATKEYKRHFSTLKEKVVFFPKRGTGEQQKIADCLSSLDELIATYSQKVAALKAHKKGLMQQLFPK